MKLHRYPHFVINCVPLPRDIGDMASIYFKKALLECEAEWSMNKKVVDLKGKNIRKGIPKGLPYFWVDFGMDPGYAHVIEDQTMFPKTFAEVCNNILYSKLNRAYVASCDVWQVLCKIKFIYVFKKENKFYYLNV